MTTKQVVLSLLLLAAGGFGGRPLVDGFHVKKATIDHLKTSDITVNAITVQSCTGCGGSTTSTNGVVTIDPSTLGTLALWLKSDVGVYSDSGCSTPATSGPVGCWADQSGNAHQFSASGALRPTVLPVAQARKPALFFYNAEMDDAVTGLDLQTFSLCTVIHSLALPSGGNSDIFSEWNNGGGTGWIHGLVTQSLTRDYLNGANQSSVALVQAFSPSMLCATYDGTSHVQNIYVDGALVSTRTSSGSINYGSATASIGGIAGGASEPYDGEINEILLYSSVLSPAVLGSAFTYARERWNIGDYDAYAAASGGSGGGVTTASAPLVVSGANLSIPAATDSVAGYMTAADHKLLPHVTCDSSYTISFGTVAGPDDAEITKVCTTATTNVCDVSSGSEVFGGFLQAVPTVTDHVLIRNYCLTGSCAFTAGASYHVICRS